ncbi:MAG TPA: hypothetical protein V6D08_11890, partial [Candidatus Obscuribacterales bacterium]
DSLPENGHERDNGITRSAFPLGKQMAGELHDNAEQRAFTPAGAESSRLVVSNGDMAAFQGVQQGGGVSVADREQAMFGNGFEFNQASNIYGNKDTVAWDPRQTYGDVRQGGLRTDVVRIAMPPEVDVHAAVYKVEHPYRGQEQQELNKVPAKNWDDAYKAFPELQSVAKLDQQDATRLMKAIVANELDHYGPEDTLEDKAAKAGQSWLIHNRTLGFSQQSPDGLRNMAQILEQDMKAGKRENNPLSQYLHMTDQQLATALEDPKQAPLFVAANLASNARMYERHNYPLNELTLGYGFNPDLPDRTGKLQHDLLPSPEQLAKSQHAENIVKWLKKIGD